MVKIYLDPPAEYETIGLVRASSSSGFTQQGDLDYAVKELKRRAAKMGANGVLLSSTGSKISGIAGGAHGGVVYAAPVEAQAAEGRAIFVRREK
jgi:ABC-type enterochelin transport system substrate-binding protein